MRRVYLLVALLLFSVAGLAHAYVGDGVCDESDLLKKSPDCSSAFYVLTPAGGPLESIRIYRSDSGSALVSLLLKNYDPQHDGYVCFSVDGQISLFDNSGVVKSVCYSVPAAGQTAVTLGIKYPRDVVPDTKVGELIIASSYDTRKVDVYVVTKSVFDVLSDPNIAVTFALFTFIFMVVLVRWLKTG